jgi:uncharacterized protein
MSQNKWRETVQAAALAAATKEERARLKVDEIAFNYRWEHIQVVVRLALRLANLTGADKEIVEASAWLHDIAKECSHHHGKGGAQVARQILTATDFAPHKIEAVVDAIVKHVGMSTAEPIEPLEAAVLWDADKLSKLGATAVLHFTGLLVMQGKNTEQLMDVLLDDSWQDDTLRSFNTAPARAAGRKRLEAFQAFGKRAAQELDGNDLQTGRG